MRVFPAPAPAVLNCRVILVSDSACVDSRCDDAVTSSNDAACFCDRSSIRWIEEAMDWMPADCSAIAVDTSSKFSEMAITLCAMACRDVRASATVRTPSLTSRSLWVMTFVIWRAESPASCASLRTSAATTAKPRPESPARAASTPAFRASRLI